MRSGEVELTLARFGGDEFIVLCEELGSEDDAVRVAERVQQALLSPFLLDGKRHAVTASIGIALADWKHRDAEDLLRDAEDLLRDADIAMYRAKETGPGRWEIFDARIRAEALARIGIERALRDAVTAGELTVVAVADAPTTALCPLLVVVWSVVPVTMGGRVLPVVDPDRLASAERVNMKPAA